MAHFIARSLFFNLICHVRCYRKLIVVIVEIVRPGPVARASVFEDARIWSKSVRHRPPPIEQGVRIRMNIRFVAGIYRISGNPFDRLPPFVQLLSMSSMVFHPSRQLLLCRSWHRGPPQFHPRLFSRCHAGGERTRQGRHLSHPRARRDVRYVLTVELKGQCDPAPVLHPDLCSCICIS